MKDWNDILKTCELQNWKEALAAVITYAQPEEFSSLCGRWKVIGRQPLWPYSVLIKPLKSPRPSRQQTGGSRQCAVTSPGLPLLHLRWKHWKTCVLLEQRPGWTLSPVPSGRSIYSFQLCILQCSCGNIYAKCQRNCDTEQTVTAQAWLITQDLVEKVVVLQQAVEVTKNSGPTAIGILLAEKMSQYANLLASQGSLSTAIKYLADNSNQVGYTTAPTIKNW